MPITKSELVKQLSRTYPNLLKKDLEKFFDSCFTNSDLVIGNLFFTYFFSLSFFLSLSDKVEKGRFFPDNGELNLVTASLF